MAHRKSKVALFMLIGSLAMAIGAVVASNASRGANVSGTTFFTSIVVATILFFIGGLFWLMVSTATKRE